MFVLVKKKPTIVEEVKIEDEPKKKKGKEKKGKKGKKEKKPAGLDSPDQHPDSPEHLPEDSPDLNGKL